MRILLRILINAIAIGFMVWLLPAFTTNTGNEIIGILVVAVIFGLVNAFIRPIVKLISLPITCLTLGLFTLVINAAMLLLTSWFSGGFLDITGGFLEKFFWSFVGAIIISIVSGILSWFLPDDRD
jgi:putative membrane protein